MYERMTKEAEEEGFTTVEDRKAARLEQMKAQLEELVTDGTITQAQVDAMLARMTECIASCDGSGCGNQGQYGRTSGNCRRGGQDCSMGCGRCA